MLLSPRTLKYLKELTPEADKFNCVAQDRPEEVTESENQGLGLQARWPI